MKTARTRTAKRPAPVAPPARARSRRLRLAALGIVIAGALAYANSLRGPFIFDDQRTIEDNPSIQHLWPPTTVLNPRRQTPVAGRPLANVSFAVNYAIGGFHVEGYHVANAAIHVLAALALFGVLRRTFGSTGGKVADAAEGLAWVCALAWLLHPLNTEAVDYITQRTESLAGLFYLLTLYAAIRAWDEQWSGWKVIAAAASACGMATKESLVTAPIVVMLYDRIFLSASWEDAFRRRARLYGWLASGWLLFAVLSTQTPFFSPVGFATRVSPWTYLLNQAPVIAEYLRLSLWPFGLVLDYGVPLPLSLADVWPSATLVVGLLLLTIVALIRVPKAGFWGAWFFITLAPASSVLPIPTEVAAERRMYLPLIAVVVAVVLSGWWGIERAVSSASSAAATGSRRLSTRIEWLLAAAMLASLCTLTVWRNAEYRSGVTIWQTVLDRRPHPRAHLNLASELRDAGRLDEAMVHLRTAAPLLPDARRALAFELLAAGKTPEATAELAEFVRLQPNDPEIVATRETLGKLYFQAGDFDRAKEQFELITKTMPQYAMGHLYLADLLMGVRDFAGAAVHYQECVRLQPNNIVARGRLGRSLTMSGRPAEAVQVFRDALRLSPGYDDARRSLIDLLLQGNMVGEAEAESRTLVAAHPDEAEAHNGLGVALASQGRFEEAEREFSEAIRLNPKSSARENLARARASRGSTAGASPQKSP